MIHSKRFFVFLRRDTDLLVLCELFYTNKYSYCFKNARFIQDEPSHSLRMLLAKPRLNFFNALPPESPAINPYDLIQNSIMKFYSVEMSWTPGLTHRVLE
ncbi:hypothetical protein EYF80_028008 [Liparis tanakae]|uniref:Uncharacterized protein n=1 Tax=Liparis tanakae TaxID=230148 RepID=A0A4Z2H7N7_9TELE|nr:hypothetical protein EYF80_028008 [Liparis tanakae]